MAKHCPCGSNQAYTACCGLYIGAEQNAPTPVALMRSRYTAFKRGNLAYIEKTQKEPNPASSSGSMTWLKLEILNTFMSNNGEAGIVEFKAHYQYRGQKHVLHEISQFCLEKGRWIYVDGEIIHECCPGH